MLHIERVNNAVFTKERNTLRNKRTASLEMRLFDAELIQQFYAFGKTSFR